MPDILHLLRVAAPPEDVFTLLTTEAGLRRWWTEDASIDTRPGGHGRVGFGPNRETRFRVEALVPPVMVGWRVAASFRAEWVDTTIAFDLRPAGEGCTLRFTHRGFPDADDDYALCTTGWAFYLFRLQDLFAPPEA